MEFRYKRECDGSTVEIRCRPVEVSEAVEELSLIKGLPDRWQELFWHVLECKPNEWGDDVMIAWTSDLKIGYSTFDGWCTTHLQEKSDFKWGHDPRAFAELMANVSCGECEIEETGA